MTGKERVRSSEPRRGSDGRWRRCLLPLLLAFIPGTTLTPASVGAQEDPPSPSAVLDLLADEATRGEGVAALTVLLPTLPPEEGTLWLQLLSIVQGPGREGSGAAVAALRRWVDSGEGRGGARILEGALEGVPSGAHPPILALAALLAEGDDPEKGAALRERILRDHPEALEAPEAALRLGGWLLGEGGERARGAEILVTLIVGHPEHPVAPTARRLLQAERGRRGNP